MSGAHVEDVFGQPLQLVVLGDGATTFDLEDEYSSLDA